MTEKCGHLRKRFTQASTETIYRGWLNCRADHCRSTASIMDYTARALSARAKRSDFWAKRALNALIVEEEFMARQSAGVLLYRRRDGKVEVLLVHPGGPFFAKKDAGAWTIPKGEPNAGEALIDVGRREFLEETGFAIEGHMIELTPIKQKGGKVVHAWAVEGDIDIEAIHSNTFEIEWPPRSGKRATFPEVDRAAFFDLPTAREKINPAQAEFLERLRAALP